MLVPLLGAAPIGAIMRLSYKQLISEHDDIALIADRLLASLSHETPSVMLSHLAELARLVRSHMQNECRALAEVDPDRLGGPWQAAWGRGMVDFKKLQADWIMYLQTWDEHAVTASREDFVNATELMLPRLRARMATENEALYAAALQTSAIALA